MLDALPKTHLQFQEMVQNTTHSLLFSEDLEARNKNISNTLVELSVQVEQLQAQEQNTLKDNDIIVSVNYIAEFG